MASKHRKTYDAIHADPVRANIAWNDVLTLLGALGASVTPAGGSMHSIDLNGQTIILHKPHPGNEISRTVVRRIRGFLGGTGVNPDDL